MSCDSFDFGKTLAPISRRCVCGTMMEVLSFEPMPIADKVRKTWICPKCGLVERRFYDGYRESYDGRDVLNL